MGTCIRNLSDGAVLVAEDDTWIEGKAIQSGPFETVVLFKINYH